MKDLKKVTVMLPADLLERATTATGKDITPTIREALEAMAASHAFEGLRRLRGKVKLFAQSCLDHKVPLLTRDKGFQRFAKAAGLRLL